MPHFEVYVQVIPPAVNHLFYSFILQETTGNLDFQFLARLPSPSLPHTSKFSWQALHSSLYTSSVIALSSSSFFKKAEAFSTVSFEHIFSTHCQFSQHFSLTFKSQYTLSLPLSQPSQSIFIFLPGFQASLRILSSFPVIHLAKYIPPMY